MTGSHRYVHSEWMAAGQSDLNNGHVSITVLLVVLVIGAAIYGVGYAQAVMHRANKDYKATKAAVKPLRKGFWKAWWAAVKIGFWVFIAFAILVTWVGRDIRSSIQDKQPVPATITSAPPAKR